MRSRYNIEINENRQKISIPYLNKNTNTNDTLLKVLCFLKAYASSTYTNKGSFKEYFKDVFDIFYKL